MLGKLQFDVVHHYIFIRWMDFITLSNSGVMVSTESMSWFMLHRNGLLINEDFNITILVIFSSQWQFWKFEELIPLS